MKRNEKKAPGFDEIIFENRNKEYGAFDLRRRYEAVTSFSILGGSTLAAILLLLISTSIPDEVSANPDPVIFIVIKPDNTIKPDKVEQPEPQKKVRETVPYKYIAPDVVEEDVGINEMMIADFATDSIKDGEIADSTDPGNYDLVIIDSETEMEPVIFVEEQPLFPGGNDALLKYISESTVYPQEALDNNIQGKVFIKFAVWADGSVKRIEVVKGVHPLLDQEALRVVTSLPRWSPGKQNGKPVPVWFFVPVTFQLRIN
jgi:protein TonB